MVKFFSLVVYSAFWIFTTKRLGAMAATTLTTTMTTVTTDKSNWRENKALVWIWKGVEFVAAQWLLIGFGVACVLGCFFPREFSLLHFLLRCWISSPSP